MHIVLVYRYYNDGIAYYNLTFVRKISNDRFGFITTSHFVNFAFPKLAFIKNSALAINRKCGILYTYRVISQRCVSTG